MRRAPAVITALSCLGLLTAAVAPGSGHPGPQGPKIDILLFTRTTGFRHPSIPFAVERIHEVAEAHGISVTDAPSADAFTDEGLAPYDAVVWLSTTGNVGVDPLGRPTLLGFDQMAAFERYIRDGGGFVGIHAASDCCYTWTWYAGLLGNGAYFGGHPGGMGGSPGCLGAATSTCFQATVDVEDPHHPSTRHLPEHWNISDELYNFRANPRSAVHVLATLNEGSYNFQPHPFISYWGALMGDHPITWCHIYDQGRVWYTGLGHDEGMFARADFMESIVQGIRWAAGKYGHPFCGTN